MNEGKIGTGSNATVPHRFRLTSLDGGAAIDTYALSISNNGYVAGARGPVLWSPFRYRKGRFEIFSSIGGDGSIAAGINDHGTIVGRVHYGSSIYGFIYDHDDSLDILTNLSWAHAINSSGAVVGSMAREGGSAPFDDTYGYVWVNGIVTPLDPGFATGLVSITSANDINDDGWITGEAYNADLQRRAFLSDGTTVRDLGALGGYLSVGRGISSKGHVTGEWIGPDSPIHAFLYDGRVMRDLGTLGGRESWGYAVNARGHVVGQSLMKEGAAHAFFFDGERMLDLNALVDASAEGWVLYGATDINDRGQIVGTGSFNGRTRAFLLTPSP
ncbi:hypothetical protein [Eleftheria terrae]|uniref:hypothetical protein n=1 Tax=Eleftheria terrae TaxID=1597781 RepID=UPI00263ACBE8|nr:hypothetical protein [Eleftheria terrae]WKB55784.1 hypothetical protein N7L95_27225 [Eleftheria terrae]